MKTPYEIKNALKQCSYEPSCRECHYGGVDCANLEADALGYIQQLENHIGELTEKVAQFEAAQPKWISVDERLPDEPGEVLACVYGRICIAWYSNRCFETPSGMVFYACENAVTHWMPTPEPPKDEP